MPFCAYARRSLDENFLLLSIFTTTTAKVVPCKKGSSDPNTYINAKIGYLQFFHRLFAFSEVQCGDPMSVKDGFIEVSNFKGKYVFGSLATYHCNPGYILWGNASRLCAEDGTWTGIKPQCKPITCGQPPEVSNTRFQLMNGSTSWQSLAKYSCKPGHSMVYEKRMFHIFWYKNTCRIFVA